MGSWSQKVEPAQQGFTDLSEPQTSSHVSFEPGDSLVIYGRNTILKDSVDASDDQRQPFNDTKVGILGAGIAGLYAALILDSLGIEYEILEASDRTGGRIFTYNFPGGDKYDYYEAGAMRFPLPEKTSQGQYKNGITKRLAKLIEYGPLNQGRNRLKDRLINYHFEVRPGSKPGTCYVNGTHVPPFGAQAMGVDDAYIRAGVEAIFNDITEPFIRMLFEDIETGERKGWETLMANDSYALRSYMTTKYIPGVHLGLPPDHLPNSVINWCGVLGYDNEDALSETVLSSMLLPLTATGDTNRKDLEWKCFEGGSETLPKRIEEYLRKKGNFIRFNSRVTAISQSQTAKDNLIKFTDSHLSIHSDESLDDFVVVDKADIQDILTKASTRKFDIPAVTITVNGNEMHDYSHVISTIPLPVLHTTIDLSGAGLDIMQRNALNVVDCYPILKIAILFKSNWWTTKLGIVGGESLTDLPLHEIIYPSYGVDSNTPSKVLIASYTWGGDALRFSTLSTSSRHPGAFKELVLRNLAEVHGGLHPDVTYAFLEEQFVDMHVKDWIRDEYAMAPYAVFPPGYFRDLYPSLIRPAVGNRLHLAGDAISHYHGWVVGALISSWRAVNEYLEVTGQDEKMKKFKTLWGENPEWYSKPPS